MEKLPIDALAVIFDFTDRYYVLMQVCTKFRDLGIRLWSRYIEARKIAKQRKETKIIKEWIDTHIVLYEKIYEGDDGIEFWIFSMDIPYDIEYGKNKYSIYAKYVYNVKSDKNMLLNKYIHMCDLELHLWQAYANMDIDQKRQIYSVKGNIIKNVPVCASCIQEDANHTTERYLSHIYRYCKVNEI